MAVIKGNLSSVDLCERHSALDHGLPAGTGTGGGVGEPASRVRVPPVTRRAALVDQGQNVAS
ncbi:hypothetical protein ACQEVB_16625 [Pseudonocardia sp. CA-107938]|uniref:hypothetical protein n=1 Tax=Pseudonocardia sp. CA-107938 TaxID=3240021 RepID=UPI003D9015F2